MLQMSVIGYGEGGTFSDMGFSAERAGEREYHVHRAARNRKCRCGTFPDITLQSGIPSHVTQHREGFS